MRVRKVVTRIGKRFGGRCPSAKMGRMVHRESLLERDAIQHLEYRPLIVSYQEQPSVEPHHEADGIAHKYVPDFLSVFSDRTALCVEVKLRSRLTAVVGMRTDPASKGGRP